MQTRCSRVVEIELEINREVGNRMHPVGGESVKSWISRGILHPWIQHQLDGILGIRPLNAQE